ncbi:MAG: hypothetical protein PHN51_11765 [Candidatus Nanopelagicales bacterium]|nr:hypothetical protein [Candidatus Nanopelagicales bacterium]
MRPSRLFSAESDSAINENPNELLLDKVLALQDTKKDGMSVTAELLQKRQTLKADIEKQMKETPAEGEGEAAVPAPASEDTSGDNADNTSASDDKPTDAPAPADTPAPEAKKEDGSKEEDHVAAADDVDSLKSMVGSAKAAPKEDTKTNEAKPGTESFKTPAAPVKIRPSLDNMFTPLAMFHRAHKLRMGGYAFATETEAKKADQHPVVYAKKEVLDSMNRLIAIAQTYIDKNKSSIAGAADGIKRVSERLTVYESLHAAKKFHFTNDMVSDHDILKMVSVPAKSDPAVTGDVLVKYLDSALQIATKLAKAPIEDLSSAFKTEGFTDKTGVVSYDKILPGFFNVQLSVGNFTNYIETDYKQFQVYALQQVRQQELYELSSISMTDDKDFKKLMEHCSKITVSAGLTVDNLNLINESYSKFIDEVKAITYDVEKETRKDLSQLGLDEKMKDFIRFKLMTEIYLCNIDFCVKFLTGVLAVLGVVSKLAE